MVRIILLLAASVMAQQVYENAAFNTRYESSPGWALSEPKVGSETITATATRIGLQPFYLSFNRHNTDTEALFFRSAFATEVIITASKSRSAKNEGDVPTFIADTTIVGVRHLMGGANAGTLGTRDQLYLFFASSQGGFSQTGLVFSSADDLTTNFQHYLLAWQGASYRFATSVAKTTAKPRMTAPAGIYDFLGRRNEDSRKSYFWIYIR